MTPIAITLPWPPKELSPNARLHWAAKAKAVRAARVSATWAMISAVGPTIDNPPSGAKVHLRWTFHPPDKRPRDLDNMIASTKAYSDGLADILKVNDARFVPTFDVGDVVKGGCVRVEITG